MRQLTKKSLGGLLVCMLAFVMMITVMQPALSSKANESESGRILDYNEAEYDSYEEAVAAAVSQSEEVGENGISDNGESVDDTSDVVNCSTVFSAGKYVRNEMVQRKATIKFKFKNSEGYDGKTAYYKIRDEIFRETGTYYEGAYLMWNWAGTDIDYLEQEDGITYIFRVKYLSSAYQEKLIDAELDRLFSNEFAGWENMHDYEKVKMVYAWMTSTYEYVEGDDNHSTYSAIINHRTVCQGFATSMYRILGDMGLSIRLVENGEHGWNIVQLGKFWYSLDATWDVGFEEEDWLFFLPDEYEFTYVWDHYRGDDYDTAEYHTAHPMAGTAYDYELEKSNISVYYKTHVQTFGWQNYVYDGAISGTTGLSKRLEGIQIKLRNTGDYNIGVEYQTHIQSYGWEKEWKSNDQFSGTSGEAKRLEAIRIRLTGQDADKFDIWYRVHAQSYGWLGWAKNGQEAGTAGQGKRLESIQIIVLPKGYSPDGLLGYSYVDYGKNSMLADATVGLVNYKTHVQSFGWQGYVYDGSISGTMGYGKRLEGINISLGNTGYEGGIRYITHVQTYGWQGDKDNPETWKKDGEMSGTSGEAKRLEGIRIQLYGEVAEHYDVYYRVHAQTYGWLDWACNGADAGTAGLAKRLEAIQIVVLPKGSAAPGNTATPFVTN